MYLAIESDHSFMSIDAGTSALAGQQARSVWRDDSTAFRPILQIPMRDGDPADIPPTSLLQTVQLIPL